MRKNRKLFSLCIAAALILLGGCSKNPYYNINSLDGKKNIAVILKMNTGNHWGTIKLGADAAAREFNVDLDYATPDDEEDINGQIRLVNQKLDDKDKKVDALILAASDYEALVPVTEKAYKMGIPVIIIDSEVKTDKIDSYIAVDDIEAGKKAANMLVSIAGTRCTVAIMSFVKGSKNAVEREEGLRDSLSKYHDIKIVDTEYSLSNPKIAKELTKKIITKNKNLDAIVALNETSSEGVAEAIDEMGLKGKVKIIAFDSTQQEIDYIENGTIQAAIIQNPFSIGYLAVKTAVDLMDGKKVNKRIYTETKAITRDNMYLPENQKLLFPFIK